MIDIWIKLDKVSDRNV